jgi:hypothetical protein
MKKYFILVILFTLLLTTYGTEIQPKSGRVRCRTEPFTCTDGNNTLTIINDNIITVTGNGTSGTLKSIFDSLNE